MVISLIAQVWPSVVIDDGLRCGRTLVTYLTINAFCASVNFNTFTAFAAFSAKESYSEKLQSQMTEKSGFRAITMTYFAVSKRIMMSRLIVAQHRYDSTGAATKLHCPNTTARFFIDLSVVRVFGTKGGLT